MLQQTQVAAVVPYYERWMRRFPTRRSLARARLGEVLKVWEGLGYYARARNLHRAARQMRRWPRTAAEWREIPGVGGYTAAAIASIAFGERVGVFDGNVRRVLSRLEGRDAEEAPLPPPRVRPGDFNQALMELGQRVCRARRPRCGECPLAGGCRAHRRGEEERWPSGRRRPAVPRVEAGVGIVWKGDRVYVQRRPAEGLLGGLWEFPWRRRRRGESWEACVSRAVREGAGLEVRVGGRLGVVRHRYSHFAAEFGVYGAAWRKGRGKGRWVRVGDLGRLAMSSAARRMAGLLKGRGADPVGASKGG